MKLAKVIGTVVSTKKIEELNGLKLLILQPLNADGTDCGRPVVAGDTIGAGCGEIVSFVQSKEAAMAVKNPLLCIDAGITGIVDSVFCPES